MDKPVIKHNPAFLTDRELEEAFVIRQTELDLILETIQENTNASNQHLLLIGARGMGKTMLVRRTAAYVTANKELSALWYPIVFSEESYEVSSAAEFWLKAVFHLAAQTGDAKLHTLHDRLREERNEKRLYEKTLGSLMDFADKQKKRLLVIAENINMIFNDQIDPDQSWDIRHTLQTEPRIMLLATAPTRFDEIDNSERAMFDLFKIHPLDPLDLDEAAILWESLLGEKVSQSKIRPLQILTGGNPRLLTIISTFAAGATFRELMKQLTFLIDDYTNYFKSNIESLAALERKVFVTLANIWEPAEAKRVAEEARLAVNTASSYLKRLENRGAVSAAKIGKGKKSYQVTERLYNIYHLMRISGKQSDRVRAVVDFMVNFYEEEELAARVAQLTEEACFLKIGQRSDHLQAIRLILKSVKRKKTMVKILDSVHPDFLELPDVKGWLPRGKKVEVSLEDAKGLSLDELVLKISDYMEGLDVPEYIKVTMAGTVFADTPGREHDAMIAFKKSIELNQENHEALKSLGELFLLMSNFDAAENSLKKAHNIQPEDSEVLAILGIACIGNNKIEDAERAFHQTISLNPKSKTALAGLGFLFAQKGSYDEAETTLIKSIEIDPDNALERILLGDLYANLRKTKKAEDTYRKAYEDFPEVVFVKMAFAEFLYENLEQDNEAEEILHEALKLEPTDEDTWELMLKIQQRMKTEPTKVVEIIENYITPNNKTSEILNSISWSIFQLHYKGLFLKAEEFARDAVEMTPEYAHCAHTLASILGAQRKWRDALSHSENFVNDFSLAQSNPEDCIDFFTSAAAAGYTEKSIKILQNSPAAQYLEPLVVALQMDAGVAYNAPQEVVEVAKDVLARIEEKRNTSG